MYQKQKGLAMNGGNFKKIYPIETKIVMKSSVAWVTKKKGDKKWG
jgi:hypothetical protein